MAKIDIEVKQVPNDTPHAEGAWVRYTVEEEDLRKTQKRQDIWTKGGFLERLVPPDSHPVAYRRAMT